MSYMILKDLYFLIIGLFERVVFDCPFILFIVKQTI